MAITYPLSLPSDAIATVTMRTVNSVAISQSPFTFTQQTIAYDGQRWEADVTLPAMPQATAVQWTSFLTSLRGQFGTFLMGDPALRAPLGVGGGTPLVNGGSQTGDDLVIDGAPTSTTGWLLAGDYIQLGSASTATLHQVLNDVDTDGSGNATLDLWPYIRTAPADNATVTITSTVGRWRLADNQSEWSINEARHYGVTFTAVEAI